MPERFALITRDVAVRGGRKLRTYVRSSEASRKLRPVFWFHGTPNLGMPPEPLFEAADRLGLSWVGYDRPGYGGSTPVADRNVASAAADVARIADALGVERFGVFGHSGGAPHALACAALLPDRVVAAVSIAGLAPFDADFDGFAGMAKSGVESLEAAAQGRVVKEAFEASGVEYDPEFIPADLAALEGSWSWLNTVVGPALAAGPGGLITDDLAYVASWGFDLADIRAPVLLLHGDRDRVVPSTHSVWLADCIQNVELRRRPEDGHISVLTAAEDALTWLRAAYDGRLPAGR